MHNITWDYKDPPPTSGTDPGALYRQTWGSIENPQGWTDRRLRLTRLESLDADWAQNRRFVSPYYWAPQRWGYNVVKLHPEAGATRVRVIFRGVTQSGANSGWRYGLVATNSGLTTSRYSSLESGADGEIDFCVNAGENLYLGSPEGQSASGTARILGDVEYVATNKSSNVFYGLVNNDWAGVASVTDVTVAPPYAWRP
jgi:hypothetical protein